MALVPSSVLRLCAASSLGLAAGILLTSCATGGEEEAARPEPPSDGGFAGKDGGGGEGGTGGSAGSSGGGSGGEAGTGAAGGGGAAGTGGSGGGDPTGQCGTCYSQDDCLDGFTCVTSPDGYPFCAADCSTDPCPAGNYECLDLTTYAAGGLDGGPSPSGMGCVPAGGESCPCTSVLDGETRPCTVTNTYGTCTGSETCSSGSWSGCDAADPEREICDGIDNNCNGMTDMDEPGVTGNDLCSGGSSPPHSGFTCVNGQCELAGCEPGWARYPPSLPVTAGCACKVDDTDVDPQSNEACPEATDLGSLPDQGGTPVLIEGTLHSDTDVDWYAIQTVDTNQVPSFNTYRVHVEFLEPDGNPGDEYRFDVIRGSGDPCSGEKTSLTSYDWCADSTTNPSQPADDDQSAPYRLKVYRNPAVTGTCNGYKIRVTNGGSGACPAADACGS